MPPVIVIQGDHGPEEGSASDRMSILNAIYLGGDEVLEGYSTISPVNTFRLVLDDRFDARLPLLEDTSLFSTYTDPYEYREVPFDCSH